MSLDHTYASAIVGAQKTHKRKAADFYPSPPHVTEALMRFLKLPAGRCIWEPACGDGAMSKVLKAHGHDVYSTDLRTDTGYAQEGGLDFLAYDEAPETGIPIHAIYGDWIITNPPFGVAEAFIRKSLSITPNVAMLLKSQFWHAKRREPLFREHPPTWVLPLTWRPAFLEAERGRSPLMDVIWVVWSREGCGDTIYRPLIKPDSVKTLSDDNDLFGDILGSESTINGSDNLFEGL